MENETYKPWQQLRCTFDRHTIDAAHHRFPLHAPTGIEADLQRFLDEWYSDESTLCVHTSGSTGTPKEWRVRKELMMNSARTTCDALNLHAGDRALLCMSLDYIAGKMMIVRALTAGLELVVRQPSGHPFATETGHLHFAALIPLQVYNSMQTEEEKKRLTEVDNLIIGGGAIDPELETALRAMPNRIYSTYGMTETLSHVALRRLNGPDASMWYHPFPSVHLSLSKEQTLVIDAPLVCEQTLHTNDVAELRDDGSFRILGRRDNIVNSGGIKIQLEQVEAALHSLLTMRFALTSVPHPKFGEALVLLLEGNSPDEAIAEKIRHKLPRYHCPKYILHVDAIPETETGKINRAASRELARRKLATERNKNI